MSKRVPRLKQVLMNERDQATGDPLIWCEGDDGEKYMLQLDESMLIPLAQALTFEADREAPPGKEPTLVVLHAKDVAIGLGPGSVPTLRFDLENGAHLGVSLQKRHLPTIRNSIAEMEVVLDRETRQ